MDDNEDAAETMAMLIEQWGHRPLVATCGEKALLTAAGNEINVALLDLCLPAMDGIEVARRLLENCTARRPLLIAVTGFDTVEIRELAHEVGFDELFVKPVDLLMIQSLLVRYV